VRVFCNHLCAIQNWLDAYSDKLCKLLEKMKMTKNEKRIGLWLTFRCLNWRDYFGLRPLSQWGRNKLSCNKYSLVINKTSRSFSNSNRVHAKRKLQNMEILVLLAQAMFCLQCWQYLHWLHQKKPSGMFLKLISQRPREKVKWLFL
jgi:hypothetical protein